MSACVAPLLAGVLGLVMVVVWPDHVLSPDAVSYYSIAGYWADGEWAAALNGYWSPLLPMLLAPAALLGLPLHLAARLLGILIGCAMIALLQRLMEKLDVPPPVRVVMAMATVPFAVYTNVVNVAPDALVAVLLLGFVTDMASPAVKPWRAGAWAALAFLAKSYALPFALAYLGALAVVRSARRERRKAVSESAIAGGVCVGIASLWIVPISIDAGVFTLSTSSTYHRVITAPGSLGNPYDWAGLIEPEHERAVWGWENPPAMPRAVDRPDMAALTSPPASGRLTRVIDNVERAVRSTSLVFACVIVAVLGIGVAATGAVRSAARGAPIDESRWRRLELALATCVYVGGLLVLVVNARYLYFPMLLAVALAAKEMSVLDRRTVVSWAALALVAFATAVAPMSALVPKLERFRALGEVHRFIESVEGGLEGRRLASFPPDLDEVGPVCFEAGCVYLGGPRLAAAASPMSQLDTFDVDLFVVIGERRLAIPAALVVAEADGIGPKRRRYTVYELPATLPN